MEITRKDVASLTTLQLRRLSSFLGITGYYASTKHTEQLDLVWKHLLHNPGSLPVKAWLDCKEHGKQRPIDKALIGDQDWTQCVGVLEDEVASREETMEDVETVDTPARS